MKRKLVILIVYQASSFIPAACRTHFGDGLKFPPLPDVTSKFFTFFSDSQEFS